MEDMNMSNETQNAISVEIPNFTYRLVEMKDAMQKSLENCNDVLNQQKILVNVINDSTQAEMFKEFTEGLASSNERLSNQRAELATRIALLDKLLANAEKNEELQQHISTLCAALGIFSEQK